MSRVKVQLSAVVELEAEDVKALRDALGVGGWFTLRRSVERAMDNVIAWDGAERVGLPVCVGGRVSLILSESDGSEDDGSSTASLDGNDVVLIAIVKQKRLEWLPEGSRSIGESNGRCE